MVLTKQTYNNQDKHKKYNTIQYNTIPQNLYGALYKQNSAKGA